VSSAGAGSGVPAVPGIQFVSAPAAQDLPSGQWAAVIYRSEPLLSLLKGLNDYSNNIFKPFADAAGGASAIETLARNAVPAAMRAEITLGDGAGEDPRNRLSPRAAVRLLRSLEQELAMSQHTLADVLPVAGVDAGTLLRRLSSPEAAGRVVGKTGTFGDYGASALVGAVRTQDRGTVYFAVLDHDVPVPEVRRRQDKFVRALLGSLRTVPWDYQRDDRPAVSRADISIAGPEMRPDADCSRGS
jgi:serine-type D-Ala-D-Ala carboxypeptidase/endopeptidase (penicillin-binding protein 4)